MGVRRRQSCDLATVNFQITVRERIANRRGEKQKRAFRKKRARLKLQRSNQSERPTSIVLPASVGGRGGCACAWQFDFLAGLQFSIRRDAIESRDFISRQFTGSGDLRNGIAFPGLHLCQSWRL